MKKDNLHVNIFSVFMEEILEEMRDRLIGNMATHNNVPGGGTKLVFKEFGIILKTFIIKQLLNIWIQAILNNI